MVEVYPRGIIKRVGGSGCRRTGGRYLRYGYGGLRPRSRSLLRDRRFEDDLWARFLERRVTG
jgi:hypothetical protein